MAVFVLINISSCRCCSISSWVLHIYSTSFSMGPYFCHWRGSSHRTCLGSTCDVQSCWKVRLDWLELVLCPTLWISLVTHFGSSPSPHCWGYFRCSFTLFWTHDSCIYILHWRFLYLKLEIMLSVKRSRLFPHSTECLYL